MKKLLYLFLVIIIMACDFETSNNGKLDGNWQLAQLDTLSTGGSGDMRSSGIYLCVQHHLLEMKSLYDIEKNVFFRFEQTETTLRLYNPVSDNKNISDSVVTSPLTLQPFGLQSLDEMMAIEQLTSDNLTLRNDKFRYHFRKF